MSAQPIFPPLPLLDAERSVLLARLTDGLDAAALNWISGYAAGLAARGAPALAVVPARDLFADVAAVRITVLYGSQTGNAKREAERLAESLRGEGADVRLVRADAYPARELADERVLFVVISTQGEGEPPDDARSFVEFVAGRRAPRLEQLQFAVLGLGDSSYPQFNAMGRVLDARFEALGAKRLFARGEADVDVATVAAPWLVQAREQVRALKPASASTPVSSAAATSASHGAWHKEQPYTAELLTNQRITARESAQDVRHLEILLDPNLGYEPGDALGVKPRNAAAVVERLVARLGWSGHESVRIGDEIRSAHDWLEGHRELTRLHRGFVQQHAARAGSSELDALLAADAAAFNEWLTARQIDDVLAEFPAEWAPGEFVAALRPLAPRLYSIASSRKTVGDEAHLAVAVFDAQGPFGAQRGVASGFLADAAAGASLPVYVEANDRFRLPQDASRDVLMIGPGTGVAPFRGFVQERSAVAASGRNWLFFGARHARSQFLYQLEWQAALKAGTLHRLDLAFSRDSAERVYVQQRLREHGREVYAWLEGGAHLYVCGAIAMGKSVHAALRDVVIEHGGRDAEAADDYLNELQRAGRYARDVY
ncbi:MAG TPA: assimilatory sulfite reductase (NADPH) flavoprotein subunit [Pseudomonadota bacterium]|jgi:sulfite reductase (NADPH) flavoprotein alpha-component|nr:assimilatory sulfite reductase (NADPH) flavoprotein subunit [Pseudomonadota bacterium]